MAVERIVRVSQLLRKNKGTATAVVVESSVLHLDGANVEGLRNVLAVSPYRGRGSLKRAVTRKKYALTMKPSLREIQRRERSGREIHIYLSVELCVEVLRGSASTRAHEHLCRIYVGIFCQNELLFFGRRLIDQSVSQSPRTTRIRMQSPIIYWGGCWAI